MDKQPLVTSAEGVPVCAQCGGTGIDSESSVNTDEIFGCRYDTHWCDAWMNTPEGDSW